MEKWRSGPFDDLGKKIQNALGGSLRYPFTFERIIPR
jgi:hypothetical protein